jgi:hypothetical protein
MLLRREPERALPRKRRLSEVRDPALSQNRQATSRHPESRRAPQLQSDRLLSTGRYQATLEAIENEVEAELEIGFFVIAILHCQFGHLGEVGIDVIWQSIS